MRDAHPTRTRADERTRVLHRLSRLEGQVRGIRRMVEEERSCREVLTLLAGVRSALDAVGDAVLEAYLRDCEAELSAGRGDPKAVIETVRLLRR